MFRKSCMGSYVEDYAALVVINTHIKRVDYGTKERETEPFNYTVETISANNYIHLFWGLFDYAKCNAMKLKKKETVTRVAPSLLYIT